MQFVRPVHGLIMLHGDKVIAGEVLGLNSGNATRGHRFLSQARSSSPMPTPTPASCMSRAR
ncbi:Glycine--tRNA ligase beta subunit [Chromobacterium violaceum]|uniref:Glycine--tRNA ligase beta subunit n=1 Tax=Chromobacterium violaceum TaxID=536 RepID=A0A3S4JVT6_CHRVL|nr:Glycine--tRNA ligase beta subunit [Chromobacterium violaceum]